MNRLAQETSPYLLQHADNPVDWYPWGDEAFSKARAEDKPVLLSVGYAACHWCHVMEHESFEDEADGRAHERALRQRQGRPRGAARRRLAVHGRGRRAHGAGRLADDRLSHAGGRAVPRRHLLPARAAARAAELPAGADRGLGRVPRAPRRRLAPGVGDRRGRSPLRRAGSLERSAHREHARRGDPRARSGSSTRSGAAGAARRSSRRPRRSSSSCACTCAARRTRSRWSRRPSTRWPPAACTTSSAAASTGTRSTASGSSRTSRRCSTTTRCSPRRTSTPGS